MMMILYRPVGPAELELIAAADARVTARFTKSSFPANREHAACTAGCA
jgi:hypothetical protein